MYVYIYMHVYMYLFYHEPVDTLSYIGSEPCMVAYKILDFRMNDYISFS